jgi:hypothetical protein
MNPPFECRNPIEPLGVPHLGEEKESTQAARGGPGAPTGKIAKAVPAPPADLVLLLQLHPQARQPVAALEPPPRLPVRRVPVCLEPLTAWELQGESVRQSSTLSHRVLAFCPIGFLGQEGNLQDR